MSRPYLRPGRGYHFRTAGLVVLGLLSACGDDADQAPAAAPPPTVSVVEVEPQSVTPSAQFVGRVAAIEKVDTYDLGRPAMPWLIGILVNQAKRIRRRRGQNPEPARVQFAEPADPALVAADAELAEQLARRLRALPAGYRETMTLRFVHGLMPLQIAHALGVAPNTVKTRLRRGTEMLRRALPVGFTTAVAAVVRGVRDEHLDRPTPCPGRSVAAMLDHLAGLALAFAAAGRHEPVTSSSATPLT